MKQWLQQVLERAHAMARMAGGWPGFRLDEIPIILHVKERAYLVGHPAPPAGYELVGQVADRLVQAGPTLPEMAANTAATVAGCLAALVQLPEESPAGLAEHEVDRLARLILHEAFHVFQLQSLTAMGQVDMAAMQVMARYPEQDPTNNAMAIVENQLLATALEGGAEAVGSFLAMRQHRHRRLTRLGLGEVVRYEQVVEAVEGTPTYLEVWAGKPLAEVLEPLRTCNLGGRWAAYRRFYYTGAAQALLLDAYAPGWQERLCETGQSLQELLMEALGGGVPPVSQVVQELSFVTILAEEERREQERQVQIQAHLATLEEGAGVRVEVQLPPTVQGVMWDPNNLLNVDSGRRLHTRFCGAVGPGGLKLEIEALCLEEWGKRGRCFICRLPERPKRVGVDPFQMQGPGLSLTAPQGSLVEEGEALLIRVEME